MTSTGVLVPTGDGETYVFNVLGSEPQPTVPPAQVRVLRPAPVITARTFFRAPSECWRDFIPSVH